MALSGTNTFNRTRDQIINRALEILGAKTRGRTPTSEETEEASIVLNLMVKNWKTRGSYLWKATEGTLFIVVNQASYVLDGSTANSTESFNETTTTAAAASGASSVVVTSAAGFTVGYFVGVVQDDNTIHWTTVSSVVSLTIGLTANLTASAASGNAVFVYQTKINRPERISSCRLRYNGGVTDTIMTKVARSIYHNYPNKTSSGKPTLFFYDKQLTSGELFIYPTPDLVTDTIKFTFDKQFDDFSVAIDDPDFPPEWLKPISLGLAYDLTYNYGTDSEKTARIKADADEAMAEAQGYDKEAASLFFQPDLRE